MTDDNKLGRLVTRYRERAKLTKAELARRSGVSAPYLTQIESGDRMPSETVLRQLAGALGVVNIELLRPAGILSYSDKTLASNMDRKLTEIIELVRRYDEDEAYVLNDILQNYPNELARFYGSGPAMPTGPADWDALTPQNQKLIEQLITKLLLAQTAEEEASDADQA